MGCELMDWRMSGINSLVVDGTRAYIGGAESGKLIVYEIHTHHWWVVNLTSSSELKPKIPPTSQLTMAGSTLYMASELSDDLYEVNINPLRLAQNLNNVGKS